jgi:hypothetical protein
MASRAAIATMDADERNRFRLVTARLSKRLGVAELAPPDVARQPELARVYELRTFNDFLEGLDASIKDEGYTAAPGESKADQIKAEEEAAVAADDTASTDVPMADDFVPAKPTVTKSTKAKGR